MGPASSIGPGSVRRRQPGLVTVASRTDLLGNRRDRREHALLPQHTTAVQLHGRRRSPSRTCRARRSRADERQSLRLLLQHRQARRSRCGGKELNQRTASRRRGPMIRRHPQRLRTRTPQLAFIAGQDLLGLTEKTARPFERLLDINGLPGRWRGSTRYRTASLHVNSLDERCGGRPSGCRRFPVITGFAGIRPTFATWRRSVAASCSGRAYCGPTMARVQQAATVRLLGPPRPQSQSPHRSSDGPTRLHPIHRPCGGMATWTQMSLCATRLAESVRSRSRTSIACGSSYLGATRPRPRRPDRSD